MHLGSFMDDVDAAKVKLLRTLIQCILSSSYIDLDY